MTGNLRVSDDDCDAIATRVQKALALVFHNLPSPGEPVKPPLLLADGWDAERAAVSFAEAWLMAVPEWRDNFDYQLQCAGGADAYPPYDAPLPPFLRAIDPNGCNHMRKLGP